MIGVRFVMVSELLCESVGLRAGQRVLDVATGTGNSALAAARRFCDVTGIDFVPAWLERARERAGVERLPVTFQEGDAEDLAFPEHSFDTVLSTFGCMFAPDQEKTASELLRVCRPGGRIGLACWTPDGYAGQMAALVRRYAPPPPADLKPPFLWGTEEGLRALFQGGATSIQTVRRTFHFRYRSVEEAIRLNRQHMGMLVKLYETLDAPGRAQFEADMTELMQNHNRSGDDSLLLPSEYLEVVITKAGGPVGGR